MVKLSLTLSQRHKHRCSASCCCLNMYAQRQLSCKWGECTIWGQVFQPVSAKGFLSSTQCRVKSPQQVIYAATATLARLMCSCCPTSSPAAGHAQPNSCAYTAAAAVSPITSPPAAGHVPRGSKAALTAAPASHTCCPCHPCKPNLLMLPCFPTCSRSRAATFLCPHSSCHSPPYMLPLSGDMSSLPAALPPRPLTCSRSCTARFLCPHSSCLRMTRSLWPLCRGKAVPHLMQDKAAAGTAAVREAGNKLFQTSTEPTPQTAKAPAPKPWPAWCAPESVKPGLQTTDATSTASRAVPPLLPPGLVAPPAQPSA